MFNWIQFWISNGQKDDLETLLSEIIYELLGVVLRSWTGIAKVFQPDRLHFRLPVKTRLRRGSIPFLNRDLELVFPLTRAQRL